MILILGGGLAGLSTSIHLERLVPGTECLVLEKEEAPGGLCRSRRREGFTFDFTGHYLHLRDLGIIGWVDQLLGGELERVERKARIHSRGKRLRFPYQANLHGLPEEVIRRCVADFVRAVDRDEPLEEGTSFARWARRTFGDGIAEEFMLPYNRKLFGIDPEELTADWVSWSVPRPSKEEVLRGALGLVNEGMGYNPEFLYPKAGGIGRLVDAVVEQAGELRCGAEVVRIDARLREIELSSGEVLEWQSLVSTLPLPELLRRLEGLDRGSDPGPDGGGASPVELAGELRSSAVVEVALGVHRAEIADGAHWIYFPEPEYPFYRVGFPSNVCSFMAPEGCSSVSVEFSVPSGELAPSSGELVAKAREGLERSGVLHPDDEILVEDLARIDPAYVIFDKQHGAAVAQALERLEAAGIHSIGRFGAWSYSYMERALLDGAEVAKKILEPGG